MSILVAFLGTAAIAIGLIAAGTPDRWLYPICLIAFVVLAGVLHGAESETHA